MKYHPSRLLIYITGVLFMIDTCASETSLDHISPLISWIRSSGGVLNTKLEIRPTNPTNPQFKLGIFAKRKIKRRELLMNVPPNCVIRADSSTINETSPMKCSSIDNLIKEMRLGDVSNFAPHVNYLLSQGLVDLPSAWSDEGKQFLMEVIGQDRQIISAEDMFGWIDEWTDTCNATTDDLPLRAALSALQNGQNGNIIPLYDLMSHRIGYWTNAKSATISHDEEVRVRTTREIEAGEQIYMSYNFCEECTRQEHFYGTPQILRDHGFVEQYPQRWIFSHLGLAFDIDKVTSDHEDSETVTDMEVSWVRGKVDNDAKAYFKKEIERLSAMSMKHEGIPEREARIALQFYHALMVALKSALQSSFEVERQECSGDSNECDIYPYRYDSLDEEEDDLEYNPINNETYYDDHEDIEDFKSNYQEISFCQDPNTKDTCLELDDIVQICGSYRPHYHEMFVHYTARFLPTIKRVAFVGGGDSMLLHEILKYPSLELAIGLELDQLVVRSSFEHFGTQPHWDNPKVQWWFGDATKSLLMLPHDYFGSFDMVLVDLSETVMSLTVTDELDVIEALSLLLKPEGILVKNEMYFDKLSEIFDYTMNINIKSVPWLNEQNLVLGSNKVDFIHGKLTDHSIDNLFIKGLDQIEYQHEFIHDYRYNKTSSQKHCKDRENEEKELALQKRSPGILMILEAEETTANFQNLDVLRQTLEEVIEKESLTVISAISSMSDGNRATTMIIFKEGYITARTFSQFNYCAFDIHLWSSFEKHENIKKALTSVIGSTTLSSYRIVAGGMFGMSTWKHDEKNCGPKVTQICEDPSELTGDIVVDQNTINTIIEESLDLVIGDNHTVVVVCGQNDQLCESVDVVKNKKNVGEVLMLSTCPEIDANYYAKNISEYMLECEVSLIENIKTSLKTKKIRAIVIDSATTKQMGQIIHKIVAENKKFFSLDFTMIAMVLSDSEEWKRNLLERVRKHIEYEPVFRAEVILRSTTRSVELGVTTYGDDYFLQRLQNVTQRIEKQTKLATDIRNVLGGVDGKENIIPSQFFLPSDYNQSEPLKQWNTQQPLGYQILIQLEQEEGTDTSTCTNSMKLALQRILLHTVDESLEMNDFDNIGDGFVVYALWSEGNAVVVWDGRNHVDINLFTYEESKKTSKTFKKQLAKNKSMDNFKIALYDEQPRGYGRVVNFIKDLKKPRGAPHWA